MFDCNSKLYSFYESKVRLKEKHDVLREYRDLNIQRLKDGIRSLNKSRADNIPMFIDNFGQGSMAMHTINQAQNGEDHDIDHALIFDSKNLSGWDHKSIKQAVADALCESNVGFSIEPEARKNAVTIWYASGYHVDFAIYKKESDFWGNDRYFHAGGTGWNQRDPDAITRWFDQRNKVLSPKEDLFSTPFVKPNQLRRLVRLFKFWSKSRAGWSMPSGLVLTALLVECYQPHSDRDDIAFIKTLQAIRNRLEYNKDVTNPADVTSTLIFDEHHKRQIQSLLEKLSIEITRFSALQSIYDEKNALKIWGAFFNSDWWSDLPKKLTENSFPTSDFPFDIQVRISPKNKNRPPSILYNPNGEQFIPKKMNIKFQIIPKFNGLSEVTWKVSNSGDEAIWQNAHLPRDGHVDENSTLMCSESSAFRGDHTMTCSARFNGKVYTRSIPIRIR